MEEIATDILHQLPETVEELAEGDVRASTSSIFTLCLCSIYRSEKKSSDQIVEEIATDILHQLPETVEELAGDVRASTSSIFTLYYVCVLFIEVRRRVVIRL